MFQNREEKTVSGYARVEIVLHEEKYLVEAHKEAATQQRCIPKA
jgi:hypothetical protein